MSPPALAAAVHCAIWAALFAAIWSTPAQLYMPDSYGYDRLARSILSAGAFSLAEAEPYAPSAMRTPLYPLFLAGCLALLDSPFVPICAQLALNLGTIYLTYRICGLLAVRVQGYAPLLVALSGAFTLVSLQLLTESLATFVLLGATYATLRLFAPAGSGWRLALVVGGGLGLSVLCRPGALFLAALLPLCIGAWASGSSRYRLKVAAIAALAAVVVLVPWVGRNAYHFGSPRLDSTQGYNLYFIAWGSMLARESGAGLIETMDALGAGRSVDGLNELELDAQRQSRAIAAIAADPLAFAVNSLYGLARTTAPISPKAVPLLLGQSPEGSISLDLDATVAEGAWGRVLVVIAEFAGAMGWQAIAFSALFYGVDLLKYGLVLALIIGGSRGGADMRALYVLLAIAAYHLLISTPLGPLGSHRFRALVEPHLCIAASCGLATLLSLQAPQRKALALKAGMVLAGLVAVQTALVVVLAVPL